MIAAAWRVASVILFRAVLEWVYVDSIAPRYAYLGFEDNQPLPVWWALSFIISTVPAFWSPHRLRLPSDLIGAVLLLLVIVPTAFVPLRAGVGEPSSVLIFLACLVLGHALVVWIPSTVRLEIAVSGLQPFPWAVLPAVALLFALAVAALVGLPTSIPSLSDVYLRREEYASQLSGVRRFVPYLVLWSANVLVPLLIVSGASSRRWWAVASGFGIGLMLFAVTGMKSILGGMAVSFGVYALVSRSPRLSIAGAAGWATALVGGLAAVDEAMNIQLLSGIITRRIFATPGLLSGSYVEFFTDHDKYLLSHSIAGALQDPVYIETPARLIGGVYFGDAGISANAHFFGDAFANFGYFGVLAYSVILAIVCMLLNWSMRDQPAKTALAVVGPLAFMLANSSLLTVMSTHGLAFMLFTLLSVRAFEVGGTPAVAGGGGR